MNRQAAVVESDVVVNVIMVDDAAQPPFSIPGAQIVVSDTATIGDHYDGTTFTKPTG